MSIIDSEKRLVYLLIIAGLAILVAGCTGLNDKGTIRTDQYVFVEHYVETRAELIGDPGSDAYVYLGYETYNVSNSRYALAQSLFPTINESMKGILADGSGIGLSGCHGAALDLYGVYSLPYHVDNLSISAIGGDGTVYADYGAESIVLAPSSIWYNNSSRIELVHFRNDTVDEYVKIQFYVTDSIRNFGAIDK